MNDGWGSANEKERKTRFHVWFLDPSLDHEKEQRNHYMDRINQVSRYIQLEKREVINKSTCKYWT